MLEDLTFIGEILEDCSNLTKTHGRISFKFVENYSYSMCETNYKESQIIKSVDKRKIR